MVAFQDDDSHSFGYCEVIAESEKAIGVKRTKEHVEEPFEKEPFWVPKSVLHDDSEVTTKGDTGDLVVKLWWAQKNGHA